MALSWSEQILPAGALTVPVEMAYLDRSYIHLYLNDVEVNDFTWDSDTLIRFGAVLEASTKVTVVRRTARDYLYILFAEGAAFIKENLDTQNTQFLHLAQELVEGRAIDGFFGEINMNGYRITNLHPGTAPGDAVNKEQLDEVDTRVTQLEQTFIVPSSSYPWFTNTLEETDVLNPGLAFTKAAVYINGVCQTPGYSYEVVDNTIMLADPVPAGTHVLARLGEDVPNEMGYATTAQLSVLNSTLRSYADEGDAGVLDTLYDQGITGSTLAFRENFNWQTAVLTNGQRLNLRIATMINTPAGIDIASTDSGSAILECTGVNGNVADLVLTTSTANNIYFKVYYIRWRLAPGSRTFAVRQGAISIDGINSNITSLTNLSGGVRGLTAGTSAAAGVVGEVLTVEGTVTSLTSGASVNLAALSLPAGVWQVSAVVRSVQAAGTSAAASAGLSTTSATLPVVWYQQYTRGSTASGTVTAGVPSRILNLTAASTSLYCVGNVTFTNSCTGQAYITAVRVR